MAEIRLISGILGIYGPVFCFSFVGAPYAVVSRIYRPRFWRMVLKRGNVERKTKCRPTNPKIPDASRNSAILPIRSVPWVPWGPGRRSAGGYINTQHPTRGHYISQSIVDGATTKGEQKTGP